MNPSTDNYVLGKGVLYFDKLDNSTGLYTGERDLGNAPSFAFNVSLEELEHYSSRSGLKAQDQSIISQITPGVTFTLDELSAENLALLTLADTESVTQAAASVSAEEVIAHVGKRSVLSKRSIGLTTLSHGTVSGGPFTVGEIVTQTTSGATGIVSVVDVSFIQVAVTSGAFADALLITGGTSSATATTNADPIFVPGVLLVQDETDTTTYASGTDYIVDTTLKDDKIGRILIPTGSAILEGATIHVTFGCASVTYTRIKAFKQTKVEGRLRFVSDNAVGEQQELEIWRVSVTPSGDTAMIGDDFSTIGFTGKVLKDETGHPDNPYMEIIIE